MMDLLPPQLKTMIKGGLRDVRHVARKIGDAARTIGDSGDGPVPPDAARLIGKVADYSDKTLTAMETITLDILTRGGLRAGEKAGPLPLERYFTHASTDARFAFARDGYAAAKQVMRVKDVSVFRVSEASLEAANGLALRKTPKTVLSRFGTGQTPSAEDLCIAAACLAQAVAHCIVVHEPRHFVDERRDTKQDASAFIAAALAMAGAVASYHQDLEDGDDVYGAVCSAIDSKYALIRPQLLYDAAPGPLSQIFLGLIKHIP